MDYKMSKEEFDDILLDSLPNPVYYKDVEGRFVRCNKCFSDLVKTPKKDIFGKLAYKFFPKEAADRHKIIDKRIMKTFETILDEVSFLTPDGEIKYFTLNKVVHLNDDGSVAGIVCVMNDITERIRQKELLIQQSKFAEMGEMIASIAHQWNEPLVEISAQIQKMQILYSMDRMDKDKLSGIVNDSMVQVEYMSDTLNDFRNFLKPSSVKKEFGIKKAIKEIFEIVGKQIFYFNIKVEFDYEDDEEIFIYGFENEVKQVLLNIINNAKNKLVKLDEKKGFNGTIKIKVFTNDKSTIIEIADNGGAIEKDIMEQVFEPFFTTKSKGMGFGLYMAKVIVEDKMSGEIKVENREDNVIFSIKLPNKEKLL
ncbi:ATP-binding protein [Arcobacter peruensis]|uniref:ATP-binding protein n=1 Tax=Arcobacter peruensis TaxID=2320140 RepID=UPI000F0818CB|nr:ATP-binding protein [Arcobacter peruensis]